MAVDALHWGGQHGAAPVVGAVAVWNGLASSAYRTWALRRAELTAFAESPFRAGNGARVTMAHIRSLAPRTQGLERLLPIGKRLLAELSPRLTALGAGAKIALVLCLPERMADGGPRPFRGQRQRLERELGGALTAAGLDTVVRTEARGHAAFAYAILEAGAALGARKLDAVVVGGLDTGYDAEVVELLLRADRLFDGENLDSRIPGEGGAFLLLGRRDAARQGGWSLLGTVEGAATNQEPATADNDVGMLGLGLSRAARAIGERLGAESRQLDWWISDSTAENHRVSELQLAWPRAAAGLMPPTSALDFLVPHLGDLGAAAMPTAAAIALEGMRRGAPVARNCLVTGSSDGSDRGVVLLARPAS